MPGLEREGFKLIRSPFSGELVHLRAIEETDVARLNELIWVLPVMQGLSMPFPESVAQTRAWWQRRRGDPDGVVFGIETAAGALVGGCSLEAIEAHSRSAQLGIWISEEEWGRGFGTDAVRTLCRFGFREMNLARVGLLVYETNPRAMRVYEKVGFKEEGRRPGGHFVGGRRVDVIVMGLLADDLIES